MRAAFLVAILLLSSPALAHGDAQWIMDDPRLRYCCGIDDCERAPPGTIVSIPGGWEILATGQRFMEGDPDLHWSRDNDFWWCRPKSMFPLAKCLMRPPGGV